jgi:hypothetical protein
VSADAEDRRAESASQVTRHELRELLVAPQSLRVESIRIQSRFGQGRANARGEQASNCSWLSQYPRDANSAAHRHHDGDRREQK